MTLLEAIVMVAQKQPLMPPSSGSRNCTMTARNPISARVAMVPVQMVASAMMP